MKVTKKVFALAVGVILLLLLLSWCSSGTDPKELSSDCANEKSQAERAFAHYERFVRAKVKLHEDRAKEAHSDFNALKADNEALKNDFSLIEAFSLDKHADGAPFKSDTDYESYKSIYERLSLAQDKFKLKRESCIAKIDDSMRSLKGDEALILMQSPEAQNYKKLYDYYFAKQKIYLQFLQEKYDKHQQDEELALIIQSYFKGLKILKNKLSKYHSNLIQYFSDKGIRMLQLAQLKDDAAALGGIDLSGMLSPQEAADSLENYKRKQTEEEQREQQELLTARRVTLGNAELSFEATDGLGASLLQPLIMAWIRSENGLDWPKMNLENYSKNGDSLAFLIAKDVNIMVESKESVSSFNRLLKEGLLLRVYVHFSKKEGDDVFDALFRPKADILLTGRHLPSKLQRRWLDTKAGKPQNMPRKYCVRLCSDALVFLSQSQPIMSENQLLRADKVFFPDQSPQRVAASIMGFTPSSRNTILSDANEADQALVTRYSSSLILSSFQKSSAEFDVAIKYPTSPASSGKWIRPRDASCKPSLYTINANDYPYTYRINMYRLHKESHANAARVNSFIQFATLLHGEAQKIIAALNYVPLRPEIKKGVLGATLTDKDLPIAAVLSRFNNPSIQGHLSMGYSMGNAATAEPPTKELRGVKLSYPINFNTNEDDPLDTQFDENDIYAIGDISSIISECVEEEPIAIVLVGHADERGAYGHNKKLSDSRAIAALNQILLPKLGRLLHKSCDASRDSENSETGDAYSLFVNEKKNILVATLGCSIDRPLVTVPTQTIHSSSSEAVSQAYAPNRRVEIFIVWPHE